ncbi:MAG: TerC family protein [Deinococcales bacterium]|nr:TerC family protein [Deinococcales bacterium]
MEWITSPEAWVALATLTVLEIVLGIDNIVFISILSSRLPQEQQPRARLVGLGLAMFTRIALLFSISWLARLTEPLFGLLGREFTGRDLVFLLGGLFLIFKATQEIHERLEGPAEERRVQRVASFASVITQIILLDIVFSLDSVITAVGMADHLAVMVTAVVIAVALMMFAANPIAEFVERHPTVKMLALAFLLLIGTSLVAEGLGQHIPKGYIYFAMGFSITVEFLNMRARRARAPVGLYRAVPPGIEVPPESEAP